MSAYIGLCHIGKPDFEAIHEKDYDPEFYALSPGVGKLFSEAALRQRMDKTGESKRGNTLAQRRQTVFRKVRNQRFGSGVRHGCL